MWVLAAPAHAHTELEKMRPADGAKLDRLPAHLRMVFSEEVSAGELTVIADGVALPVLAVPGKPHTVKVDLRQVEPSKTLVLSWKVIDSQDGHESEGALELHVRGSGGGDPSAAPAEAGTPPEPRFMGEAQVGARTVGYLAMAVLIGGLFFVSAAVAGGSPGGPHQGCARDVCGRRGPGRRRRGGDRAVARRRQPDADHGAE